MYSVQQKEKIGMHVCHHVDEDMHVVLSDHTINTSYCIIYTSTVQYRHYIIAPAHNGLTELIQVSK